jgi:hypothetical protein
MAVVIAIAPTLLKAVVTTEPQPVPCQPQAPCENSHSEIVAFLQPNSPQTAEQVGDFLDRLSRKVHPDRRFVVHRLKGQQVEPLYANIASGRRSLLELYSQRDSNPSTQQLEPVPSNDRALVQAFQIAKEEAIDNSNRRRIYIYLVTPGTSNPSTLTEIHHICEKLAEAKVPNLHLYLVGLAPENRLPMANAIAPMGKHARSAGTNDSEWIQLLNELK